MKNNIIVLFACILAIAVSSCKKVDAVNQNLNPDNQKAVDFMSTKNGSYWRYGARESVPYTRYARDKDSVVNNLKYSYYERQDDSTGTISPEFFGKNGQYHYTLVDIDGSRTTYLEYAFWKDSARQGDSWNNKGVVKNPLTGGNIDILIESNQSEDGVTMSSGGKTFNNVVHVHADAKATIINAKIATFDIWFIKGLGVIREEAHINILGAYTQDHTDSLLDYHIEL